MTSKGKLENLCFKKNILLPPNDTLRLPGDHWHFPSMTIGLEKLLLHIDFRQHQIRVADLEQYPTRMLSSH